MPLEQFKRLIDSLDAFDFATTQDQAIATNKDALVQYQVEQFAAGIDSNNNPILLEGSGYSTYTIINKRLFGKGLGAVTGRVTLFQSGALYRETFVSMQGQKVTFSSKVPYFSELMQRTGDVTGLNEGNQIDFAYSFVLPFVSKELKGKTGLSIRVGGILV